MAIAKLDLISYMHYPTCSCTLSQPFKQKKVMPKTNPMDILPGRNQGLEEKPVIEDAKKFLALPESEQSKILRDEEDRTVVLYRKKFIREGKELRIHGKLTPPSSQVYITGFELYLKLEEGRVNTKIKFYLFNGDSGSKRIPAWDKDLSCLSATLEDDSYFHLDMRMRLGEGEFIQKILINAEESLILADALEKMHKVRFHFFP